MYQQEVVEYFEGTDHYLMENENKSYSLRFRSFDADITFKVSRSTSVNANYSTFTTTQTNIVKQFDPFNMVLRIVNKFYLIDSRDLKLSTMRKIVFDQKRLSTTPLSMTEEDEVAAVLAKYRITAIRNTPTTKPADSATSTKTCPECPKCPDVPLPANTSKFGTDLTLEQYKAEVEKYTDKTTNDTRFNDYMRVPANRLDYCKKFNNIDCTGKTNDCYKDCKR